MDLNTISAFVRPASRGELGAFEPGDAWLAGGTWLFSEPQPKLNRLIDLSGLGWPALEFSDAGLGIAATCTIAELAASVGRPEWKAWPLVRQCCLSLLGSFKIWNMATVGGNICMALPAGPMTSLTTALEGVARLWTPDGGERALPVADFVLGPQQTALRPGDVLRRIDVSAEALSRRHAFRRISLSPLGRSGALLVGTLAADGGFVLTVTASTRRPVQIRTKSVPGAATLRDLLEAAIPPDMTYDDVHGAPDWRRRVTAHFAEEIRAELEAPA
jgi:CO/xanthine dehydrogenase FAD-binding subunit